ncbi:MAG: polysaccharide deacetylase family protein [Chloroflexi bacterium]|nr:polysaccharide deacetylase family protein [Chloroflexota bacterium]
MTKTNKSDTFDPISMAVRGKGLLALYKRARIIGTHYGLTAFKMDRALAQFTELLESHNCSATFPITGVTLARNSAIIQKYQAQGIEFAVHGYTHIDYSRLGPEEQLAHLRHAREIFANAGIAATGFRSPYLRHSPHLHAAIETAGFSYVSNQPIMWDTLDTKALTPSTYASYERAIEFYNSWDANERLSLPKLHHHLVEIPVSLPDDEILLDRLGREGNDLIEQTWQRILAQTYQRGELFTIQLHPERIAGCAGGLFAVLTEARALSPAVWLATLDEIATWWRMRTETTVKMNNVDRNKFHLTTSGPISTTILARAVQVDAPTVPWVDDYQQVKAATFTIQAPLRPFIGLSPDTSPKLIEFLQQQGYIIEISKENRDYAYYFDRVDFAADQECLILAQVEETDRPLVRLGRWPNGARSALSVTGDIDALTLWDYGLRFLGK